METPHKTPLWNRIIPAEFRFYVGSWLTRLAFRCFGGPEFGDVWASLCCAISGHLPPPDRHSADLAACLLMGNHSRRRKRDKARVDRRVQRQVERVLRERDELAAEQYANADADPGYVRPDLEAALQRQGESCEHPTIRRRQYTDGEGNKTTNEYCTACLFVFFESGKLPKPKHD